MEKSICKSAVSGTTLKRHLPIVIAALTMVTLSAEFVFAQGHALDCPQELQVFQRNAKEFAEVRVAGTIPPNATIVEAKAELPKAMRGKAVDWTVVADNKQIKDGKFSGSIKLATGGWYKLTVRFRKSAADKKVLAEASVEHVGVGDVFIIAGQSNSANYGNPKQKSMESLSVYFGGGKFTPAADPIPDSCGKGGTPWPILGDMLSRTTRAPVCFRSATVNYRRVRDWLPGASYGNIERLVERAKWFGPSGFRAVLWVQGEADAFGTPAIQYEREAKAMIEFSRKQLGWNVDWFVACNSYYPPDGPKDWKCMARVLLAQKTLCAKGVAYRGPDTNDLIGNRDYRHDGIHFGPRGLLIHAERWYAVLSTHYHWVNPITEAMK